MRIFLIIICVLIFIGLITVDIIVSKGVSSAGKNSSDDSTESKSGKQ